MNAIYLEIKGSSSYFILLILISILLILGIRSAYYIEYYGHCVTGMSNQITWGIPHVFAIFLILVASGSLNVASAASVFRRILYMPLARLSGLLAIASLAGGLMILVLDLGRPDRIILVATTYNLKSTFTWNIFLYTGLFIIVCLYLWSIITWHHSYYLCRLVALASFLWRLVLTTSTGSTFGFLVARDAYNSAIMAPLFMAMSLTFGQAALILALVALYHLTGRALSRLILTHLQRLTGIILAINCYFVIVQHLTSLYTEELRSVEVFLISSWNIYSILFWVVQITAGTIIPLILLLYPRLCGNIYTIILASILVIIGGLAQVYIVIVGGQAFPITIFPGLEVTSSYFDSQVGQYMPTLPEVLLGLSGLALTSGIITVAISMWHLMPSRLTDIDVRRYLLVEKKLELINKSW